MKTNKLLRLINRAQIELDEARREVEHDEIGDVGDDLKEVRARLDALEIRVSVIEEGHA